ncbi:MAG: hypothetical protein LBS64_01060, partial [Spirochaetaceae bacterium]|nr:hypothetical protein [Spirochaetaceae bacterium]
MLKKKIAVLAAVFVLLGASRSFSLGMGIQGGLPGGVAFTFGVSKIPLIWTGTWYVAGDGVNLSAAADYWFTNPVITNLGSAGTLNWFLGVGAGVDLGLHDDPYFGILVRVPAGINT